MMERNLPTLYPDSKYGHRMPIGLMSVIDSFPHDRLRRFYHKWHSPRHEALVIVGHFDPAVMEAKVKTLFSTLSQGSSTPPMADEPVPDNDTTIVVVDKDKEHQTDYVQVMFKHPSIDRAAKQDHDYLVYQAVKSMAMNMLSTRLSELAQSPTCPYLRVACGYGTYLYSKTKYAFTLTIIPREGRTAESITAATAEVLRAARHGFTQGELDRAKAHSLAFRERLYATRHNRSNANYCAEYVEHFLSGEPIPSQEDGYRLGTAIIDSITAEHINAFVASLITTSPDKNTVILNLNRQSDSIAPPTSASLRQSLTEAFTRPLTPYIDQVRQEPLIATMPTPGRIVSRTTNDTLGYTTLYLSNGARAIIKKTDHNSAEILMRAYSRGGTSLLDSTDFHNLPYINKIIGSSGLGTFTIRELQKKLAGSTAGVSIMLDAHYETVIGSTSPKDVETMFQLTHLHFTHITPDTAAFRSLMAGYQNSLKNKHLSPEMALSDSLTATLHSHNPRFMGSTPERIERTDYPRILQIARERTANAADFTFLFVGNYDEATLLPLIERYIASLPSDTTRETSRDIDTYPTGIVQNYFKRTMQTPQARAYIIWHSDRAAHTLANKIKAEATGHLLTNIYIRKIREEASAAYSVNSYGSTTTQGSRTYTKLYVICPMKPDRASEVLGIIRSEVETLSHHTDSAALEAVKQYMLKKHEENLRRNTTWIRAIEEYETTHLDPITHYRATLSALTPTALSTFVNQALLTPGNRIEVVMLPEEE